MSTFARGLDLSENAQALDAICAQPPGEHFLGTEHTLANFETAFVRSELADPGGGRAPAFYRARAPKLRTKVSMR